MNQTDNAANAKSPEGRPGKRWLRWTARLCSLASLAVMTLFMIAEDFDPTRLHIRDWYLAIFFPLGLVFGLILGWRQERLGGAIALVSLAAFYAMNFALAGSFPEGWAFAALGAPGGLFLLSAAFNRPKNLC
jgi:peptidoglycan/LPS O-acetylase OafA/YrhL